MTARTAILSVATTWLLSIPSHTLADDSSKFIPPAVASIEQFPVPEMTVPRADVAPFEYQDVGPKIPNYLPNQQWGTQGDIITKMQKPLPPEESVKHYVVPKDFHLELFLDESDLQGKPISMNWDELGRLWISETVDYPDELMPPSEGRDRIRICEDTDQDGRADKFTVFAENLSIPTGIEFCREGIVLQAGVETLFLRDTDGDGKADQREVLITGWAMNDTHGGVSNFQYGLDNRYWAMQGYNDSKPKYAGGEHPGFRQGPWNFTMGGSSAHPEVTNVEFIRSTNNNSWGLGSSEEGLVFASTANGVPSVFVPIPNRYYESVRGWTPQLVAESIALDFLFDPITENVRQVDWHGGYTAGAGHALYTARTYPKSWWNRVAFVCGPTGHLVGTYVLERDGANYKSDNPFNLVASNDEWSAPIMAEVGPDGNVWIIDWYNFIIQHNPVPNGFKNGKGNAYESDLRDKSHGRIYRLVYDGDEGQPEATIPPRLDTADPATLIAGLSHSNRLWRRHAQRLLVERGNLDVVDQLIELIQNPAVDETGNNAGAIHALWTLHGLGALSEAEGDAFQAAVSALKHTAAGVRRNAALVLPADDASTQALIEANLVADSDMQVRLAALMALADMPSNEKAGEAISGLAYDEVMLADRYLNDGIVFAAAAHPRSFLAKLILTQVSTSSVTRANIARIVGEHVARSGLEASDLETLLTQIASSKASVRQSVIEGLIAGWPAETELVDINADTDKALVAIVESTPVAEIGPLLRLGALLGSSELRKYSAAFIEQLQTKVDDVELGAKDRIAAGKEWLAISSDKEATVANLVERLTPQLAPEVSTGIIRSLANTNAENVATQLMGVWTTMTPAQRTDIVAVLMTKPDTAFALLNAIREQKIGFGDLSLDQRQTLVNHPSQLVRQQAQQLMDAAGTAVNSARQEVIDQYSAAAHATGDLVSGKALFTKNCAVCHKHSGEGKEVGPDLTGMAVHPKEELLTHILDPSRGVEGNFRRYTLLTVDGKILTGMLVAESLSSVDLIDAEGKKQSVSREDIEQLTSSNKSVMPDGIEQLLNLSQMTDLLEFLTNKGRFVPLPIAKVANAVSTKELFDNQGAPDTIELDNWDQREVEGIPFQLVDPQGDQRANIVVLHGNLGVIPPKMPRSVKLPCNMIVKNLHILGAISGYGYPRTDGETVSMVVRLHYQDGELEDHELINNVHIASFAGKSDVPKSIYAFAAGTRQVRYLAIEPKRREPIESVELRKGDDESAPIVLAITAEQADLQAIGRNRSNTLPRLD
ncbi:MAG: c-type cytochrome [Pirellulaceae bacterium]